MPLQHTEVKASSKLTDRGIPQRERAKAHMHLTPPVRVLGCFISKELPRFLLGKPSLFEVAFQALLGHSKEVEVVPQIGTGDAQALSRMEHNGQQSCRGAQGPSPQVRRGLKGVGGPGVQNKPVALKILKDSKEPGKPTDCGLWIIEMAARLSTQSERQVPNPLNPKPLNP